MKGAKALAPDQEERAEQIIGRLFGRLLGWNYALDRRGGKKGKAALTQKAAAEVREAARRLDALAGGRKK